MASAPASDAAAPLQQSQRPVYVPGPGSSRSTGSPSTAGSVPPGGAGQETGIEGAPGADRNAADEEESFFGGKIDGLVFSQRQDSPELRWQETGQRPTSKPMGPPPVPRIAQQRTPWEPSPRPEPVQPKRPSRLAEVWLPVSLGLLSLTLVIGLSYAFMRMYGFV